MIPLRSQRGITITELILSMGILAVLITGIFRFLQQSREGLTQIESQSSLKEKVQQVSAYIGQSMQTSHRLFDNSTLGNAYLAKLDMQSLPPVLSNSRLPTIEENGSLSPSSLSFNPASVGNSLFYVSSEKPLETATHRIDVYVFHYYFLALGPSQIGPAQARYLWHWQSVPYASSSQIQALPTSAQRLAVIQALALPENRGITRAWVATEPAANAFWSLDPTSGPQLLPATYKIERSTATNIILMLTGRTGYSFRYSVSPNSTEGEFPNHYPVPKFASTPTSSAPMFPSGFETLIAGPKSQRSVLTRLVLMGQTAPKRFGGFESLAILYVRDVW